MLVIPPPFAVPRLTVTYSRNVLPSPTTSSARSPRKVKSCGSPPTTEKGKNALFRPHRAGPCTTACGCKIQPSPNSTSSPTTARSEEHTSELQSHHDLVC